MSTASPPPASSPREPAWREFAQAPLVPVALAASVGLLVDRYVSPPVLLWIAAAVGGLLAWMLAFTRKSESAGLWLCLAACGLAAFHHHDRRTNFPTDDIGTFATEVPTPVRIRGVLDEEPMTSNPAKPSPLLSLPRPESSTAVLAVTAIHAANGWESASGRAKFFVEGRLDGLHLGDHVEIVGRLVLPTAPSNPGEWDARSRLLDQRITAEVRAGKASDIVTRLEEGWRSSLFGWLAVVRGWGTRTLMEAMPPPESGLAAALLLGDGSEMDRSEWDAFIRTGVVHVLAISGQHLVVLAGFVWLVLRVAGVRRRRGAWFIAVLILGYAILTGGRPSAVRAAVMVCVICGGIVLRRPVMPANSFALAWLIVITLNPADPFNAGCQLSFLSVFVLIWGAARWLIRPVTDAVQTLIEESRSLWERILRGIGRIVGIAYAVSFILGVANAPLVLYWQNLVSPIGILLGPPLLFLTSIALISGFLLLLIRPLGAWAIVPLAWITQLSLAGCGWLVHKADELPGAAVYAPTPAAGWVAGFYLLLAGTVLLDGGWRRRAVLALALWTLGSLLLPSHRPAEGELRVTFLAVGHGGCVVIETPDGRVLLYDVGTTTGPEVVRRTIAPFLWQRGISRIDELFLSHADLDHFNGLPELLRRFSIGRITLTPSFPEKPSPGVAEVLAAMDRHGVQRRTASAGDHFEAGDVTLDVLHPPAEGPGGSEENPRSLVLLIRHAGHAVLLTGDLEKEGLAMLLEQKPRQVDVMLAPHHGSTKANTPQLAHWAKPKLVVSSQEPRTKAPLFAAYAPLGATVLDTSSAGSVTVRSHKSGLTAETFRGREVFVVRRGSTRN